MALYCVHCDHTFEPEAAGRARCPKCMRAKDLKPVDETKREAGTSAEAGASGKAKLALGLALLAVLGGAGAWLALGGDDGPGAAEAAQDLQETLKAQGIDASALAWLEPTDEVEKFAEEAGGVQAVVESIRARAQAGAFVPWSISETLARPAKLPGEVLEALQEDGARARLYPLEVVALAVSAGRALDAPVQAVELIDWPDAKAPVDPSGVAGYYLLSHGDTLYDVFAGRTVPEQAKVRPLSDAQFVGAALSLQAVALASTTGETSEATRLAESALKLAPQSPTVRCARAAVWASGGGIDQALREFDAAAQLRRDAARRYQLASAALLTGEAERAGTFLNQLLTEYPDYGLARVSMAALEMRRGNGEEAERQLELAEQATPDLNGVLWARAQLLAVGGEMAAAKSLAQRAFEDRKTLDAHLQYAQFQRKVGDLSEAADTVVAALEMVSVGRRAALRETLNALVGPAVMMDVEARLDTGADDGDDPGAGADPGGDFDLGQPLDLGGPSGGGPEPGLGEPPGDGPLLMMGDTSKLKLRDDSKGGLKLKLSE